MCGSNTFGRETSEWSIPCIVQIRVETKNRHSPLSKNLISVSEVYKKLETVPTRQAFEAVGKTLNIVLVIYFRPCQREDKFCSFTGSTDDIDVFIVSIDDFLGDT